MKWIIDDARGTQDMLPLADLMQLKVGLYLILVGMYIQRTLSKNAYPFVTSMNGIGFRHANWWTCTFLSKGQKNLPLLDKIINKKMRGQKIREQKMNNK